MKLFYTAAILLLGATTSRSQITITAADLPNAGDTLRYSTAFAPSFNINTGLTGANQSWNFSNLQPYTQAVDTYKNAAQVNPAYGAAIPASAFGYKAADSIPGSSFLPITIKDF
jgi:hypothetical protein